MHLLDDTILPIIIHLMETMGVFIIAFSALKAFLQYAIKLFNFSDDVIKVEMAKGLALALEFKLGSEILKTLLIRTVDEIIILASIVVLRVVLTFVIHWEIASESKEGHGKKRERDEHEHHEGATGAHRKYRLVRRHP